MRIQQEVCPRRGIRQDPQAGGKWPDSASETADWGRRIPNNGEIPYRRSFRQNNRMQQITIDNAVEAVRSRGWLPANADARAEWLSGGVSNIVIRINVTGGTDFVVKQSREQLRTKDEWRSRLDRIWREVEVQQVLSGILPPGIVPRVLFQDRENFVYAMEAVEADHVVWKSALLSGQADVAVAEQAAQTLATIHCETAGLSELAARFTDKTVFDELRLDPFYRFVAKRHSSLVKPLGELVDETLKSEECLVLADFSPKNILLTSQGIALVDFETAHFGDPAFDLGFFLSHLLLKTVLHAERLEPFLQVARSAWRKYAENLQTWDSRGLSLDDRLQKRTVQHLAGCMLARIDGKSPVDYLEVGQRDFVREFCFGLFERSLQSPDAVFEDLSAAIRHS